MNNKIPDSDVEEIKLELKQICENTKKPNVFVATLSFFLFGCGLLIFNDLAAKWINELKTIIGFSEIELMLLGCNLIALSLAFYRR